MTSYDITTDRNATMRDAKIIQGGAKGTKMKKSIF